MMPTLEDGNESSTLDSDIVHGLIDILDQCNKLVKVFRHARGFHQQFPEFLFRIKLLLLDLNIDRFTLLL